MAVSIIVHGSDGEVMAPFGHPGTFFRGRHRRVQITTLSDDLTTPIEIREAQIGLTVQITFTFEQLTEQGVDLERLGLTSGAVLAYSSELITALEEAGKQAEADMVRGLAGGVIDMVSFEGGIYQFVDD